MASSLAPFGGKFEHIGEDGNMYTPMTKVFECLVGNGCPSWPSNFQTSFYVQIFGVNKVLTLGK